MDTARLRTMAFGNAVLLLRTAAPIVLDLAPWTARPEAKTLQASRRTVETRSQLASHVDRADDPDKRAVTDTKQNARERSSGPAGTAGDTETAQTQ